MADTVVDASAYTQLMYKPGPWGPYWSDESTAIIVYLDPNQDVVFARTTDKGANWTSPTKIHESTSAEASACWYDKETPGDAGTLIHIVWMDDAATDIIY